MHICMISRPDTLFWQRSTSICIELPFICQALDKGQLQLEIFALTRPPMTDDKLMKILTCGDVPSEAGLRRLEDLPKLDNSLCNSLIVSCISIIITVLCLNTEMSCVIYSG